MVIIAAIIVKCSYLILFLEVKTLDYYGLSAQTVGVTQFFLVVGHCLVCEHQEDDREYRQEQIPLPRNSPTLTIVDNDGLHDDSSQHGNADDDVHKAYGHLTL